jgi:hypothetical protein
MRTSLQASDASEAMISRAWILKSTQTFVFRAIPLRQKLDERHCGSPLWVGVITATAKFFV